MKNYFSEIYPNLCDEWHPTKNGQLRPSDLFWWICSKGHEWEAMNSRSIQNQGCPYCSNRSVCSDIV